MTDIMIATMCVPMYIIGMVTGIFIYLCYYNKKGRKQP